MDDYMRHIVRSSLDMMEFDFHATCEVLDIPHNNFNLRSNLLSPRKHVYKMFGVAFCFNALSVMCISKFQCASKCYIFCHQRGNNLNTFSALLQEITTVVPAYHPTSPLPDSLYHAASEFNFLHP
ncbi:hypothetical protein LIER_26069 [Lithospermum erythrorhizon]|uniref:Uncharacterized protein n=1 Tax=Lithospermum erythrorhizon TaxID=34254 RepID=A0AAV3RA51_LITER